MNRRRLTILSTIVLLVAPSTGWTHPMGNFSVSHYTSLRIAEETIELRHVLDMAEIPTFQEIQDAGIVPEIGHPSVSAYLGRKADTLKEGLRLQLDGHRLELRVVSHEVIFPPGAGDLPTMKLAFLYRAVGRETTAGGAYQLSFRDDNLPDRAGWKEVIATAEAGVVFMQSSVPARDRSAELSDYPTDPASSPPQDLEAHVLFRRMTSPAMSAREASSAATPAGPRSKERLHSSAKIDMPHPEVVSSTTTRGLQANQQATPRNGVTEMITTSEMSASLLLLAAIVAMGLGALHALEPGHGKTMVAAYLVGSRGTARHAVILGLAVTVAHTAGVYLLGGITLYASRYVVPERLYPWLALASGLMIAGLGVALFRQRYSAMVRSHSQSEDHAHVAGHTHHHHLDPDTSAIRLRSLIALGVSGGIVPCPAALVVLLSAFSMRRTGFGLLLIVAFSLGLSAVLIVIGILIVHARHLVASFDGHGPLVRRWLPLTSAAVVTLLGLSIALQAVRAGNWSWL